MATAAVCVYIAALVLCQNVHGYPNVKVTDDANARARAIILASVRVRARASIVVRGPTDKL